MSVTHKFAIGDKVTVHDTAGMGPFVIGSFRGETHAMPKGGVYADGERAHNGVSLNELRLVTVAKPKRDYVADHARRTLRRAGLTIEQARFTVQAIQAVGAGWAVGRRNHAMCGASTSAGYHIDLSRFSRGIPGGIRLSTVISDVFQWDEAESSLGLRVGYFLDLYNTVCDMEYDKENSHA